MKDSQKYDQRLTCREAAIYIHMSIEWLAQQRKHGFGPAYYKYGSSSNAPVRYSLLDLDTYLESVKVKVA